MLGQKRLEMEYLDPVNEIIYRVEPDNNPFVEPDFERAVESEGVPVEPVEPVVEPVEPVIKQVEELNRNYNWKADSMCFFLLMGAFFFIIILWL